MSINKGHKTMKKLMMIILGGCAMGIGGISDAEANHPYCREFQQTVAINGGLHKTTGTACMQPDGSWDVISQDRPRQLDTERSIRPGRYVNDSIRVTADPFPIITTPPVRRPSYSSLSIVIGSNDRYYPRYRDNYYDKRHHYDDHDYYRHKKKKRHRHHH